jgi:hypothetical protein
MELPRLRYAFCVRATHELMVGTGISIVKDNMNVSLLILKRVYTGSTQNLKET